MNHKDSDSVLSEYQNWRERQFADAGRSLVAEVKELRALNDEMKGQLAMDIALIKELRELNAELVDVLSELADITDEVVQGHCMPDSFTTQPARAVIIKANNE